MYLSLNYKCEEAIKITMIKFEDSLQTALEVVAAFEEHENYESMEKWLEYFLTIQLYNISQINESCLIV